MSRDERVAIVGLGRFGRALAALCERAGLTWAGFDPADASTSLDEALADAGLVVLAVPLEALRAAILALRPRLSQGQLLVETCSVKVAALPVLNATLNATAAVLLGSGWVLIRRGRVAAHRACMLSAVAVSTAFLISYVVYHSMAGSRPTTMNMRPSGRSIALKWFPSSGTEPVTAMASKRPG